MNDIVPIGKLKRLLEENFEDLAGIITRENGKILDEAKGELTRAIENVEVACGIPMLMQGDFLEDIAGGIDEFMVRQPIGVCATIAPFNFPAMIPLWKIAPAIAAGNAFILKPSERDPSVPIRVAELFIEAGLPAGVLNVVNGDKEAVDAILDDPDIKAIGFVGSTPIAQYIYSRATANGKRAQCFGGAKNHMIVMPDADMDQTVDALIGAGYGSAGERCMAISVAVAVGKAGDALMERLVPRVRSLKIGPGTDPEVEMGPLVTKQHLDKVRGYVDQGVKEGAKLVVDGRWLPDPLNLVRRPDGFGGESSLLHRGEGRGSAHHLEFYSPALGEARQRVSHDLVDGVIGRAIRRDRLIGDRVRGEVDRESPEPAVAQPVARGDPPARVRLRR